MTTAQVQFENKPKRPEPPAPLVKLTKHPITWAWNKIQLIAWALVLAYFGMLVVAGLYYIVFQINPTMNDLWHTAVSNSDLRHNIRDIGEGLLGGLLAQQVIWNHYKSKNFKAPNKLDRLEIRLHIANVRDDKPLSIWQLLASPALALLYAIPGFFIAWLIVRNGEHFSTVGTWMQQAAQSHAPTEATTLWSKIEGMVTQNWQKKLLGYGAALFWGRRPVKGVFDDLQLWVAEWLVKNGKAVRKFVPPTLQARYNDVRDNGVPSGQKHSARWSWILWPMMVLSVGLAGFGMYVLIFIAN